MTLKPIIESSVERILVRATNWVGDAVMSIPALQALRQTYPKAHIAILARPSVSDIYAREPFADEMILYTSPKGFNDIRGKWALVGSIRERGFDTALLLQNAFEAAALVFAARIPRRIGYDRDGRGPLLTHAVPVPQAGEISRHERFYYLELLKRSGLTALLLDSAAIRLSNTETARTEGRRRLSEDGLDPATVVGISPGAAYGTAKRWLPERFAEAAVLLGRPVAIFGSANERELCEQIAQSIRSAGIQVKNFAGATTLREYIDLAAACSLYLTNDSGGMHIASALGVPTVAIFGATDEVGTGPTGSLARVVREPVECSPCLLRECPIDHRCMSRVGAPRVAQIASDLIQQNSLGTPYTEI
jgi:heptosyltransferase-2